MKFLTVWIALSVLAAAIWVYYLGDRRDESPF
jgi:hypothetical protein